MLWDVLPSLPRENLMDGSLPHAELVGDALLSPSLRAKIAHILNIVAAQLRVVVPLSGECPRDRLVPPLLDHVMNVIHLGAEKQMVGIHAVANIAMVKDKHPLWDRPMNQFPHHTMDSGITPSNTDSSVSSGIPASSPQPTFAALVYGSVKAICNGSAHILLHKRSVPRYGVIAWR